MDLPLKIIVADDERDTREYLQELLAHLGHDVRAVPDGPQLVEACRDFGPDLIVTDYAMPGLNGLSAAQQCTGDRPVPVILVTGRHDVSAFASTENGQVVRVLLKPIRMAELRGAVELAQAAVGTRVNSGAG